MLSPYYRLRHDAEEERHRVVRYSFDADAKSVARRLGDAKKSFLVSRDCVGIAYYSGVVVDRKNSKDRPSVCQHTGAEGAAAASSNVPSVEMETPSEA